MVGSKSVLKRTDVDQLESSARSVVTAIEEKFRLQCVVTHDVGDGDVSEAVVGSSGVDWKIELGDVNRVLHPMQDQIVIGYIADHSWFFALGLEPDPIRRVVEQNVAECDVVSRAWGGSYRSSVSVDEGAVLHQYVRTVQLDGDAVVSIGYRGIVDVDVRGEPRIDTVCVGA